MSDFYSWPNSVRQILTGVIALGVLSQTMLIILSYRRYPRNFKRALESLLEVLILLGLIVYSLMHGQAIHSYFTGIIVPPGYEVLRTTAFALIALTAGGVAVSTKKLCPFLLTLPFPLLLPPMEGILADSFAYLFFVSIVILPVRSVYLSVLRSREISSSISALSIKNTVDSLHTGVLFSELDGFILLINKQMQLLMKTIFGQLYRDGRQFYDLLVSGEVKLGCKRTEFEGQIVFLLPDKTAWMFTSSKIESKGKSYTQLAATDITQQWIMTEKLQRQEKELTIKSKMLRESISNLQILSREREMQKAKMRAHDVLGQRLSLLLRSIRSDETLDHDLLRSLSQGILEELKEEKTAPTPKDELDDLQQTFNAIGIKISFKGELPSDPKKGSIITDIIKESVTNAVRHGFATEISIEIGDVENRHYLLISNNGELPSLPIIEGGGIAAMRKMVEPYGGNVDVSVDPHFALTVYVPEVKYEL